MSTESLRIAVVGAGIMGADHIKRITNTISGARVVAVVEPDAARAAAAAASAPGSVARRSIEESLAEDALDAVIIATPGPFHESVLLPALEAGISILCEKPLTPDSEAALRVIEAEQRGDKPRIQVGFMRRFDPEYVELRRLVESGEAGQLLALHCAHRNASTPPGYVESMLITDSVVHEIDIVPWIAGEPIAAVEVKKTKRNSLAPAGLHEPQLVLLETVSGVLADVEINVNAQFGYQVTTDAVFERGMAAIGRTSGITRWENGRLTVAEHMTYTTRFEEAYDREVQRWVNASRRGEIDGPSAWDGYRAAVVCEAALEAQATGRRVDVSYADMPAFYAG
ncbi:Gfo/Idh/MocA family protein [Microterricola viridarii]|uniref:Inositol 2-dehydrogenase n=1 Tax=Microterricola viridarii TaxID=412690 RepID=A0A1H1NJU7_9MICO|nr:Gfo/Idh/MocA family oxidoreductase [Microterricola viridarii]SDR99143.1 myo-inositol 2-dehydrogenase [Microterricola viridarii]